MSPPTRNRPLDEEAAATNRAERRRDDNRDATVVLQPFRIVARLWPAVACTRWLRPPLAEEPSIRDRIAALTEVAHHWYLIELRRAHVDRTDCNCNACSRRVSA